MIDNAKITQIILRMFWKQNETGNKNFIRYPEDQNKRKDQKDFNEV